MSMTRAAAMAFPIQLLILVFLFCVSAGVVDSDDGATLLEMKKSLRDVDNVLYDWTSSPSSDYCIWRGVTCDNATLNAITLNLSGLNLVGEISPSVGKLKGLQTLLIGPIPSTLSQIPNLKVFDVRNNSLTGSIPQTIGNCTAFQGPVIQSSHWRDTIQHWFPSSSHIVLAGELNDNHLTGSIPAELGKLTDLFDLNVANNNLGGPIPDNLSSCTNLNSLNVHGNKLNGTIPLSFQRLESMTYLNLSSNDLQGPIPVELSRIGNLDTLDISNNKVNGTISSSFGDLEHLLKLNLSGNRLTGSIPAEFGNLRSVMEIDISHNQLSGFIPQELTQLQNLLSLRLENNNLSGDVRSLINCPSLTELNVSNNNLVTLSKAVILGIALGALVILLMMILLTVCRPNNTIPFPDGSLDKPVTYSNPKLVILHMNMALHVYEDIMRMTENLSEKYIIGHGASSTVYKCVLKNCKPVAIKKLYSHQPLSMNAFETELETVGSIKHRNLILSKTSNNAVMETVDPEITATSKDLGAVKKAFQLALLCTKRQPSDRPTMHEVTRVIGSLLPSAAPLKPIPSVASLPPSARVPSYKDEYAKLKTPHVLNCPSMSTSDAQLFLKFGEVISQNSE
ncbi:LRR receptor-like serine/threonine-protein kinase ERECTA [Cucurbita argyrosperma subsp. argyrosperma]|nr:LRR receptor-like serine/threonine-protein kinase ERECTA [Cucurbita argyrosperma subsp. argyrosperma]